MPHHRTRRDCITRYDYAKEPTTLAEFEQMIRTPGAKIQASMSVGVLHSPDIMSGYMTSRPTDGKTMTVTIRVNGGAVDRHE